jgi:hypothetical protein
MSKSSKAVTFFLCASGIALAWIMPQIILAIHDACGMSTAHEFEVHGLIDHHRLEALRAQQGFENYSIEHSIRANGAIGLYFKYQSWLISSLFGLIALVVLLSREKI